MSKLKTVTIDGFRYHKAKLRKDLLEKSIAVPIGKNYYTSSKPLPYRYVGKDAMDFEVYLNGSWQEAESIDFEFDNSLSY